MTHAFPTRRLSDLAMGAAGCGGRCWSAASGRRRRAPKRAETKTAESERGVRLGQEGQPRLAAFAAEDGVAVGEAAEAGDDVAVPLGIDRKSTRLNSSH